MITCTRRIQFCAGHRVLGHENKCANLHGHNYVVLVEAQADELDSIGRVIDFSVLKEKVGGWIDKNWDHSFIVANGDIAVDRIFDREPFNSMKVYFADFNPTAENLAFYLLTTVCPSELEGTGVTVRKVTVWETENCFAEATL